MHLRHLLLASLVVFSNADDDDDEYTHKRLSSACLPYGCPIRPLDILLDERDDDNVAKAVEALLEAGDASKTTLTLCGNKGDAEDEEEEDQYMPVNQDSSTIFSPFMGHETRQLIGVFDGHGTLGEVTSEYAATRVPALLAQKLEGIPDISNEAAVSQAIIDTFVQVDKTDPTKGIGGSTATIILQIGAKLYIGNAGDSVSFIAVLADEEVDIVYQSREDKPDLPEERKRIEQAGGYVHIPPATEDVPRAYHIDDEGHARYGLAMSRSIGDWSVQGVIPDPIVDVLNVADLMDAALLTAKANCEEGEEKKENCDAIDAQSVGILAVSASDGMMDFLTPADIAHVMAASFFVEPNPHPHSAAEFLMRHAAEQWNKAYAGHYRDDITIAATKVFSNGVILDEGAAMRVQEKPVDTTKEEEGKEVKDDVKDDVKDEL